RKQRETRRRGQRRKSVAFPGKHGREKSDCDPGPGKRIGKRGLVRPEDLSRREDQPGQNEKDPRKPPREMSQQKTPARQTGIVGPVEKTGKESGKVMARPNKPRADQQNEEREVRPVEQGAEAQSGFAERN